MMDTAMYAYYCIASCQLHTGENWENWDLLPAARLPSDGSRNRRSLRVGTVFPLQSLWYPGRHQNVLICCGMIAVLGPARYWDDLGTGMILLLGCLAALGRGDCRWDVLEPCRIPGMGITVVLMTLSPWCCGAAGQTRLLMRVQTFSLLLLLCYCRRASCPPPHPGFSNASGCFRVDSCRCIMKDGSGVMDLRTVGDADGFLGRLRPVWTEGVEAGAEVLLSFRPCQPFSQPEDLTSAGCRDVAVCLILR